MKTRVPHQALLMSTFVLLVANVGILVYLLRPSPEAVLTVSFLEVGQGDAILIEGPTGIDILIDGGRDRSVVRELPRVMGALDRTIDMVVATHPDADHVGGLPDVLSRYRVSYVLTPGRDAESNQNARFLDAVSKEQGAVLMHAKEGMRIHLGDGAYAEVLHPEDNVEKLRDTNDASIVMRVVYGDTEFLLTGDAPMWVEDRLVKEYGEMLRSDILKAGHHGSKTSTGDAFLGVVDPEVVVISAGKDNSYGHPHAEVLENIFESGATAVSTAEIGTITFVSDGIRVRRK